MNIDGSHEYLVDTGSTHLMILVSNLGKQFAIVTDCR